MTNVFTIGQLDDIIRDISIDRLQYGFNFENSFKKHTAGNRVETSHDLEYIREQATAMIRAATVTHRN